jgi:hypothetical protein
MEDYVKEEVTIIRNDVIEVNTADTDMIASPYHLTEGARGAPGVPGMNGLLGVNGYDGAPGPQGPKGPQGVPGPIGAQGSQGGYGSEGQRGPDGRIGGPGGNGPTGSNGDEGGDGRSDGWKASRYFCPGGGSTYTRLVDCTIGSCRVETHYNGVWGTICATGMGPKTANVICRGLGYPQGGVGKVSGGGIGPIWLSHVNCNGGEQDVGDCPRVCGDYQCNHGMDVGVCCTGFRVGDVGQRDAIRSKFKTVRSLEAQCYVPDKCTRAFDGQVVLGASCGNPNHDSVWSEKLGTGEWSSFGNGNCDSDTDMCVLGDCKITDKTLSSMYIPQGKSVTLYTGKYFEGQSITYHGPHNIDCLSWDGWDDKTQSLKIFDEKDLEVSNYEMRIYQASAMLLSMPSLDALEYVGQAKIPYINFHGVHTFRTYVTGTPQYNFVAVFFGQHLINTGGDYTWCTRSSDGSELYIDGALVVNNKGRHTDKLMCGKKRVTRGLVKIEARVFSSSGVLCRTLCVCVCVCVCFMNVCTHCVCVCACCMNVSLYACMCMCMCMALYTHERTRTHTHIMSYIITCGAGQPVMHVLFNGEDTNGMKFSNVLYIVTVSSKYSRALTFENLCQATPC